MATIGLSDLYYAPITESATGIETYGTPTKMAKAIQANLSIDISEAMLFADDSAQESVREFQSGTLSLGVDDITPEVAAVLLGAGVDENGVLISSSEDVGPPVAVGFRARRANGKFKMFWLYRVLFGTPSTSLQTKGDSVTFQTPTVEGVIMRRNKPDARGRHPWKAECVEGHTNVSEATINGWFNAVYDPDFPDATATGTSGVSPASGALVLDTPIPAANKTNKTADKSETKSE